VSATAGAVLRYTLDGRRPTELDPVLPPEGLPLPWPSWDLAVNVRGFHPTLLPSPTNGAVLERRSYRP
jgi:hypothetical protein